MRLGEYAMVAEFHRLLKLEKLTPREMRLLQLLEPSVIKIEAREKGQGGIQ